MNNKIDYKKLYEEALKRANAAINIAADKDLVKGITTTIFPELAESEDEKTRKELVNFILYKVGHLLDEETEHRFIAYLEKQKEIPMPDSTQLIEWWDEEEAMLKEKDFRDDTWRIAQNAFMDGVHYGWRIKQKEQKDYRKLYEDIAKSEWFKKAYVGKSLGEEEQQELPTNEEMLRTLRAEYEKGVADTIAKYEQQEQEPVEIVNYPSDVIEACMLRYLQSAANRKDDVEIVEDTKAFKKELLDIIKQIEKPVEWSEEDEKIIERLITRLNWITYNTRTDGTSPNITFFDEIAWLNNRLKSLRPQPHWKPTDEQLRSLQAAINNSAPQDYEHLTELYEQLKKLKEE